MTPAPLSRPFWRQPLLHFLLAGLAIFLLDALRGGDDASRTENDITVTVAQVERMAELWVRTWGRPPSEAELQGLVRDFIREEIYYREALKLGLDVNDTVIRRRLRQKMEFLSEGDIDVAEPDEETLAAFFADNAERYAHGAVYSFRQVYLNDAADQHVARVLSALRAGEAPERLGDTIGLPAEMTDADSVAIGRIFGSEFLENFEAAPHGVWTGPVQSSFGAHLVYIKNAAAPRAASLDEKRARVLADWKSSETARRREEAFEALRARYNIDIETPE